MEIKTPSDLKYYHELNNPNSAFFSRKTMKFFGDTMKNYGIRTHANAVELFRRKPVKHGLHLSTFFKLGTFERIHDLNHVVYAKDFERK